MMTAKGINRVYMNKYEEFTQKYLYREKMMANRIEREKLVERMQRYIRKHGRIIYFRINMQSKLIEHKTKAKSITSRSGSRQIIVKDDPSSSLSLLSKEKNDDLHHKNYFQLDDDNDDLRTSFLNKEEEEEKKSMQSSKLMSEGANITTITGRQEIDCAKKSDRETKSLKKVLEFRTQDSFSSSSYSSPTTIQISNSSLEKREEKPNCQDPGFVRSLFGPKAQQEEKKIPSQKDKKISIIYDTGASYCPILHVASLCESHYNTYHQKQGYINNRYKTMTKNLHETQKDGGGSGISSPDVKISSSSSPNKFLEHNLYCLEDLYKMLLLKK